MGFVASRESREEFTARKRILALRYHTKNILKHSERYSSLPEPPREPIALAHSGSRERPRRRAGSSHSFSTREASRDALRGSAFARSLLRDRALRGRAVGVGERSSHRKVQG